MAFFYGGALNCARGKMQERRFFCMQLHAPVMEQRFTSPWRSVCLPARQDSAPRSKEGKP
jgi:hypothetical protein